MSVVTMPEPRQDTIISNTEMNEHYEKSEHAEDNNQALRCLLNLILG